MDRPTNLDTRNGISAQGSELSAVSSISGACHCQTIMSKAPKTKTARRPRKKSLPNTAAAIVRHLQESGVSALWVGGCVRDFLLGREPEDYDIATSAKPEGR